MLPYYWPLISQLKERLFFQKIDELLEEVKKLKATIQKHELRIFDLEKKLESRTGGQINFLKKAQTNNHGEKHLMPDEVWCFLRLNNTFLFSVLHNNIIFICLLLDVFQTWHIWYLTSRFKNVLAYRLLLKILFYFFDIVI